MIFESPDKGKTVYSRLVNTLQRQPVDIEQASLNNLWIAWRDILQASRTNLALREALDRAYIIYELSRHDTD
jgi:hypothetical protein